MRAWEYLELAYAPSKPTVATSDGLRAETTALLVPDEFGWASVSLTLNELGAEGWELVGTVQVILALPPNQPHRAEIAKLLVHRSARKRGIARLLMEAAEDEARAEGKTLLVLDAVTGDAAARLYTRLGWTTVGEIPGYVWETSADGKPSKDRPLKLNDHSLDTARYICADQDLRPTPRVRWL